MRNIRPGDVLTVWDGTLPAWFIREGEAILNDPSGWNHILIMSHQDVAGNWWAIEAHPGVVGWTAAVDLTRYLSSPKTIDNARQPKTESQRSQIVAVAKGMFGTPYDWNAIQHIAFEAISHLEWHPADDGNPPTHVICSSLVAYVYRKVGLQCPPVAERATTPGDWAKLILTNGWNRGSTTL